MHNPLFRPHPLLASVPAIFSLLSVKPLPNPNPFQNTPQTCRSLGHGVQALGACPGAFPRPLLNLQQQQHQRWLAAPPLNSSSTTTFGLSHPRRISLSAPELHSMGKHAARMAIPAITAAELSKPTKSHLFVVSLCVDHCQ